MSAGQTAKKPRPRKIYEFAWDGSIEFFAFREAERLNWTIRHAFIEIAERTRAARRVGQA